MPWRDAAGRFSWLKLLVFMGLFLPALWLVARGFGGDLGARPITELLRRCGDWTVRFLLLTLAVSPARAVWDWPRVVQLRRMLGVATGCYALAHVSLYITQQNGNLPFVASEIVHHYYLVIGFTTLCMLMALLVTSTDRAQRRLKGGWKKLHRLIFPIAVLALTHYFIQSKIDVTNATFAAGVFVWLAAWRLAPRRMQARPTLFATLAVGSALATAAIEALWYGLATGVPGMRVLEANLRLSPWPRPAVWVAILFLAVAIIGTARRWRRRPRRGAPQPSALAASSTSAA